jgi:hypothetical protein
VHREGCKDILQRLVQDAALSEVLDVGEGAVKVHLNHLEILAKGNVLLQVLLCYTKLYQQRLVERLRNPKLVSNDVRPNFSSDLDRDSFFQVVCKPPIFHKLFCLALSEQRPITLKPGLDSSLAFVGELGSQNSNNLRLQL